jgi:PAB-dependent poly(A)-specific ribonuclease subunit 3
VFVYDYHPGAETLMSKHFALSDQANGYADPFNSDPNVARPYSHTKNALLRQHASESHGDEAATNNFGVNN